MTIRVKQTFEFDTPGERVWGFITNPAKRTGAISVIDRFDVSDDGCRATWYLELPIPFVRSTVTVETEDIEVDEPTHARFVGKSQMVRVTGKYTIEEYDGGGRLVDEFTIDGRLPDVEAFFECSLGRELDSPETEFRREFEATT